MAKPGNYKVKNKGPNRKERRQTKAYKTKKALARKLKELGGCRWSELEALYNHCSKLYEPINALVKKARDLKVLEHLDSAERYVFMCNIKLLTEDLRLFTKELKHIHDIHADKKGECDLEDISLMMQLGEKYQSWMYQVSVLADPIRKHLTDLIMLSYSRKEKTDAE